MLVACVLVMLGTNGAAAVAGWRSQAFVERTEAVAARILVSGPARPELRGLCARTDHPVHPAPALPVALSRMACADRADTTPDAWYQPDATPSWRSRIVPRAPPERILRLPVGTGADIAL